MGLPRIPIAMSAVGPAMLASLPSGRVSEPRAQQLPLDFAPAPSARFATFVSGPNGAAVEHAASLAARIQTLNLLVDSWDALRAIRTDSK